LLIFSSPEKLIDQTAGGNRENIYSAGTERLSLQLQVPSSGHNGALAGALLAPSERLILAAKF
jgi:hypothetical protein